MDVKEFFKVKSSNLDDNIFPDSTTDREAVRVLTEHFLGKDWYSVNPVSHDQVNTEIVFRIIHDNESYKFRNFNPLKRFCIKLYCLFTGTPVCYYY